MSDSYLGGPQAQHPSLSSNCPHPHFPSLMVQSPQILQEHNVSSHVKKRKRVEQAQGKALSTSTPSQTAWIQVPSVLLPNTSSASGASLSSTGHLGQECLSPRDKCVPTQSAPTKHLRPKVPGTWRHSVNASYHCECHFYVNVGNSRKIKSCAQHKNRHKNMPRVQSYLC